MMVASSWITGLKYLEYISGIRIMHNNDNNQTSITSQFRQWISEYTVWYKCKNSVGLSLWVAGIIREFYWVLKGHIAWSQEGTPCLSPLRSEGSWDDQVGGLVHVTGGQESQISSRDHQAPVCSDQMVPVTARQEAGCISRSRTQGLHSCKLRLKTQDAQKRVGKQLLEDRKPSRKQAEWQPKQESLTLSHGFDEGGLVADDDGWVYEESCGFS